MVEIEKLRWSDFHFVGSGINVAMVGAAGATGDTGLAALNASLLPMNLAFAAHGRKDQIGPWVKDVEEEGLGKLYDNALRNRVASSVEGVASDGDYGCRSS